MKLAAALLVIMFVGLMVVHGQHQRHDPQPVKEPGYNSPCQPGGAVPTTPMDCGGD